MAKWRTKRLSQFFFLSISQCTVVMVTSKPHFFKLSFLWPGLTNFLEISLVISKYPIFNNWQLIFWKTIDLVYIRSHKTVFCFEAFWVALGSSKGLQHFRLPLSQFLEHMNLSYLQWKRIHRAFIWHQNLKKNISKIQCVPQFVRQVMYPFSRLYVDQSQNPLSSK